MSKSGTNPATKEDDAGWKKYEEKIKTYLANKKDACGFQFVSVHGKITVVDNFEDARKCKNEVNTPIAEHELTVTTGMAMMTVRATSSALQQIRYVTVNNFSFNYIFNQDRC